MKSIQMVNLQSQYKRLKVPIDAAMQEVIENSAFINGPQVKQFATDLSNYLICKEIVPCANGTDALQIAMMACGFSPGDEVIVPAFTYVATVEVIALLGLTPVFVDVNPNDFNINVSKIEEAVTYKTVGIVPVHLFGQCADMDRIMRISTQHDVKVIEDTAQAIGATYTFPDGKQVKAGTIADIGTTSFFPSKNLGCFGDGGAMISNDEQLAQKARMIANHGQSQKYIHDCIGVNSRLDTLQAALLSVKLKHLDDFASRRQSVASVYDSEFQAIDGLSIPTRNHNSTHVFHQYTIQVEHQRDELKAHLATKGIPSMIYYPIPVHLQKAYGKYGYQKGQFPIAENLCEKVLSLPIHTEMEESTQEYIITEVRRFFNG